MTKQQLSRLSAHRQFPGWGLLLATLSLTLASLSLSPELALARFASILGVVRVGKGVVSRVLSRVSRVRSCFVARNPYPTGLNPFFRPTLRD